jgi:O-antigen ligase
VYIPYVVDAHDGEMRDPHNTVVLVASEWGVFGLMLYLTYFGLCALLLWEVRRRAPEGGLWYYRSVAIQLAMVAVFVAGLFSDRLYAEAPYWMGALAVAVHRVHRKHLEAVEPVEAATAPASRLLQPTPHFARAKT